MRAPIASRFDFLAHQLDSQPMIVFGGEVAQQQRSSVVDGDQNVDGAIVIEVADGQARGGEIPGEERPAFCAHIVQRLAIAVKQHQRLAVGHVLLHGLDQIVGIAVGQKQIKVAIVVVVEKLQPPAAHQAGGRADRRSSSAWSSKVSS